MAENIADYLGIAERGFGLCDALKAMRLIQGVVEIQSRRSLRRAFTAEQMAVIRGSIFFGVCFL